MVVFRVNPFKRTRVPALSEEAINLKTVIILEQRRSRAEAGRARAVSEAARADSEAARAAAAALGPRR